MEVGAKEAELMGSSVVAWFDAPLPGSVHYPPNPCNIVMHGASPNGVSLFELNISDREKQSLSVINTTETLSLMTMDCGINTPGNYELKLRIQDTQGNWSNYASTSLMISNEDRVQAPVVVETQPARLLYETKEQLACTTVQLFLINYTTNI